MWKELDMSNKENFNLFLNIMNNYTCVVDHHATYGIDNMNKLFTPLNVKYGNVKVFYYNDDKFTIVIGVMNYAKDENKIWSWASESSGVETKDDLIKHTQIYFSFIKDYLVENKKNYWLSGIQWKDFKPSYRSKFDDTFFWDIIDTIGHQYLDFNLDVENQLEFQLKHDG